MPWVRGAWLSMEEVTGEGAPKEAMVREGVAREGVARVGVAGQGAAGKRAAWAGLVPLEVELGRRVGRAVWTLHL